MNPLIASIINNPSAHQVNRADKMQKTIDVMASNAQSKAEQKAAYIEQSTGDIELTANHYGYDNKRRQGD